MSRTPAPTAKRNSRFPSSREAASRKAARAVRTTVDVGEKPFAIILAGHNGSGKSTFWYDHVADEMKTPLMNADRLMLSILPEAGADGYLRPWAQQLRDTNQAWTAAAQQGVQGFVGAAITQKVPFAFETVFSH
jgi:predicted ABC-type ATPase